MPNQTKASMEVKCPFYKAAMVDGVAEIKYVRCEGVTKECDIRLCYHKTEFIMDWIHEHCERYDYAKVCPIAEMLEKKYEDAEYDQVRKDAGL